MNWTRSASILHLLAAPIYAVLLSNDSMLAAGALAATLLGSAVLLWMGNRWVVIYSGILALLCLLFLFFLALSVHAPEEHITPTALGSLAYLALHAAAVLAEWVGAKGEPEITAAPD
jgi:predicted tellurium resistance membrane protein TerC